MLCVSVNLFLLEKVDDDDDDDDVSACWQCAKLQKVKTPSADTDGHIAPKPPPDPNRQLSRAGSRHRISQQFSLNTSDPHSAMSYEQSYSQLKSESLKDGISICTY